MSNIITNHFNHRREEREITIPYTIESSEIIEYKGTRQLKTTYCNGSVVIQGLKSGRVITTWKNKFNKNYGIKRKKRRR